MAAIINLGSFFIGYHLAVFTLTWARVSHVYDKESDSKLSKGNIK